MNKTYEVTIPLNLIRLALQHKDASLIKGVGLYLLIKSWFGDSRFHDFTIQRLQDKFHLNYSSAITAVKTAINFKLVEFVSYVDNKGNKHRDLLAVRCQKYGKGRLVHFSVVKTDDRSKAYIYLKSNRTDNSKNIDNVTVQYMSDIVDLLCLAPILSIMEARQWLTDSEVKKLTSKRGRHAVNLDGMSFKECRRLEKRLKRNLKVGEVTPLNSGISLDCIIKHLKSPFIKLRRVRRLVNLLVKWKLVYRTKNIIVAHDYESSEERFDYSAITVNKPMKSYRSNKKAMSAIEIFMQAHNDDIAIMRAYKTFNDNKEKVYNLDGTINAQESKRLYSGKGTANNKYFKRLADSFYIQCDIFRTKGNSHKMFEKIKQIKRKNKAQTSNNNVRLPNYELPY